MTYGSLIYRDFGSQQDVASDWRPKPMFVTQTELTQWYLLMTCKVSDRKVLELMVEKYQVKLLVCKMKVRVNFSRQEPL